MVDNSSPDIAAAFSKEQAARGEPAYKAELRGRYQREIAALSRDMPEKHPVAADTTLGFPDRLVAILSREEIGVEVVDRNREKEAPLFTDNDPYRDRMRIIAAVRGGEPGGETPRDGIINGAIIDTVAMLHTYVVKGRAMPDKFGVNHYGEGGRVDFRKQLGEADRILFETKYNRINQVRKNTITPIIMHLKEGIPFLSDINPPLEQKLHALGQQLEFLYQGDPADYDGQDRIKPFLDMSDEEKIAAARVVVDISAEVLRAMLPEGKFGAYKNVPVT